jgi:hypothetical protein
MPASVELWLPRGPARIDLRRAPRRALNVLAAFACAAGETGCVMVDEDAVAGRKVNFAANLGDDAAGLVPEHERRFAPNVPPHDIAAADAAGHRAHQDLVLPQLRDRSFFDPHVAGIVEHRRAHRSVAHGSIKSLRARPAPRSPNAVAMFSSG